MKSRLALVCACLAVFVAVRAFAVPRAPQAFAEPRAQATPAPTEEPTKAPYVFPTPIFIPTYADDTPVPRATPHATLAPGQLAGAQSYTVQPGDSLWIIAQKVYGDGTKYPLIMAANNMTSTTRLRVGSVLDIPSLSGSVPPTATTAPSASPPALPMLAPTLTPTIAAPTPRPSPTSASWMPVSVHDAVALGMNVISALLLFAALGAALMAYLVYLRARRLERLASNKQPLRITK